MSTAIATPDTEAPAKSGFQFDGALPGQCTNPERVSVPMPNGTICHILLAEAPNGKWCQGHSIAGPKFIHRGKFIQKSGAVHATREDAIRDACTDLFKWCEEQKKTGEGAAVEKFAAAIGAKAAGEKSAASWTPGPNAYGFKFDTEGECTNADRINLPVPKGCQGVLLVARMANGQWVFGFMVAGKDVPLRRYACKIRESGEATREEAIQCAAALAADGDEAELCGMIQGWAKQQPGAAAAVVPLVKRHLRSFPEHDRPLVKLWREMDPNPKAFAAQRAQQELGKYLEGSTLAEPALPELQKKYFEDFCGEALARDFSSEQLVFLKKRLLARGGLRFHLGESFADPVGDENAVSGLMGRVLEALKRQAGEPLNAIQQGFRKHAAPEIPNHVGPAAEAKPISNHEGPPAAAVPLAAATPPAAVLPGMAHEANEHGVFTSAEEVIVPMPKKAECTVRLAVAPSGLWAVGTHLRLPSAGASGGPFLKDAIHETRGAALVAGLEVAKKFFEVPSGLSESEKKIANRAGEAVFKFRKELPIDEPAAAPAVPRERPVYRTEYVELELSRIQENPTNNRKHFNPLKDRELADSLLAEGLHQAIAVRKLLDGEKPEGELPLDGAMAPDHELIFGHRRRRAGIMAGMKTLPAKVYYGLTRKQATAIALIENLQRENINAMEEAEGYAQLMVDENLTQEACADRVGRGRSTVANAVGLLRLPEVIREYIRDNRLNSEHGKALKRFVPKNDAEAKLWASENPKWETIVKVMAETAIAQKLPSGAMEKGVPALGELVKAGLVVRIDQFGEHRINGKQREHPAYFAVGDGDWVCCAPAHWQAEVADRVQKAKEREEADRLAREAELAKLVKGGRKQLKLEDLDAKDYREFSPVHAPLLALVPDEKKAAAKGEAGRTTIVTDVELADGLQKAMMRAIRKNREETIGAIEEKVRKKIAKLKRVGPRELAWLVSLLVDPWNRSFAFSLDGATAKKLGIPFGMLCQHVRAPEGEFDRGEGRREFEKRRLAYLAKSDAGALIRVLMTERLPMALAELLERGPDSLGATMLKWWLETDTLWLLEESEEGRAELVESVKASKWFAKASAGEKAEGEE